MTIQETIFKRKSTRKYDPSPLGAEVLKDIQNLITSTKPLFDDVKVKFEIMPAEKMKGGPNAPHFIVTRSGPSERDLANTGFVIQQAALHLQSIGFGTCWLGVSRPIEPVGDKSEFVISLAFGKAVNSPYRELSGFKRKPLEKISDTADKRLEPARLAPSGVNSQPWYFVKNGDEFDCYCAKKFPAALFGKMNRIDMGIALAHLYVSYPDTFVFDVNREAKPLKGYYYIGNLRI
jgi:nitroreductase